MNRIKHCATSIVVSALFALAVQPGTQALAHDSTADKTATQAETLPGKSGFSVYDLVLDDDVPVLASYILQGFELKPVIDTGDSGILGIFDDVYSKLDIKEEGLNGPPTINGQVDYQVDTGIVLTYLLGSGRQCWLPAVNMKAMEEASFNSVFPLRIIDTDFIAFLLSRNELWAYDFGPGQADITDNPAIKAIPYSESPSGLDIWISCGDHRYPVKLDTGAVYSTFSLNFVKQHQELFSATGEESQAQTFNSETTSPSYHLKEGICILGVEAKDDIPIPEDDYDTMTATDFQGHTVPDTELGDPLMLPYKRSDAPAAAPVAIIGMDILWDYDFVIDMRLHTLYLWPPSETPKLFPRRPLQTSPAPPAGK